MEILHPIEEELLTALSRTQICPRESLLQLTRVSVTHISNSKSLSPRMSLSLANLGANPDLHLSEEDYERILDLSGLTEEEQDLVRDNILRKIYGEILILRKLLDFIDRLARCTNWDECVGVVNNSTSLANPIHTYGKTLSRDGDFSKIGRRLIEPSLLDLDKKGRNIIDAVTKEGKSAMFTAREIQSACEHYKQAFHFALS